MRAGKTRACCLAMLVFLALAGWSAQEAEKTPPAKPAAVAGTWVMSWQSRLGEIRSTLTLEQDGEKIQGELKGPRGESRLSGTVKGNRVKFTIKRETSRGDATFQYEATVDGDTMKGTMEGPGGRLSRDWVATREPKAK